MAFKLKTSKKTEEILSQAEASTNIPYSTLVKLSIALSLRTGDLKTEDYSTNQSMYQIMIAVLLCVIAVFGLLPGGILNAAKAPAP